jgi:endonuclease YncB( thermonuclease family)
MMPYRSLPVVFQSCEFLRHACLVLLLAWFALRIEPLHASDRAERIEGVVLKVRDGDTLQIRTDAGQRIEVRLNAIDAPEKSHGGMRGQPHAERARLNLAQLAARRDVTLLRTTMDRYGRHVGRVLVHTSDGTIDAGWWQVRSGYAWVYERYLGEIPVAMRIEYRDAQADARTQRRGLWTDSRPIAPWEWRQRQRSS